MAINTFAPGAAVSAVLCAPGGLSSGPLRPVRRVMRWKLLTGVTEVDQDKSLIQDVVAEHQPDYVLVELGFNDMGWLVSDAQGTLDSMETFVRNARAGKSDIAFVIANIPHRSFIGGRDDLIVKTEDYNAALPDLIKRLSTNTSPIYMAQFRENYACKSLQSSRGLKTHYTSLLLTGYRRQSGRLCCWHRWPPPKRSGRIPNRQSLRRHTFARIRVSRGPIQSSQ